MVKKSLTVVLLLGILLSFSGLTSSQVTPGKIKLDPMDMEVGPNEQADSMLKAHPWQDDLYPPDSYKVGRSRVFQDLIGVPTFTNLVLQLYLKYVIKQEMEKQSCIRKHTGVK